MHLIMAYFPFFSLAHPAIRLIPTIQNYMFVLGLWQFDSNSSKLLYLILARYFSFPCIG